MASADLRDELSCSICLEVYTDPVTLSCGHNFCLKCIDRVLDTQEEAQAFSCPECRAEFEERPAPRRNITLRNIAAHFRSTQSEPKPEVFCTYCLHSQVPALKSCLHCEASLCDDHLRAHHKSPEHVLSDLITNPEGRKCSIHKKILEYYCSEDTACICVYCSARGHRGHKLEMLDEASMKKKERLRQVLETLTYKEEETEKRLQSLQERRRKEQKRAASLSKKITALFRDLRRHVNDLEKKVLSEISRQEEEVSASFSNLIHQLEEEKDELAKKLDHVEELCHMTDPLSVLQEKESETSDFCDTKEAGEEDGEAKTPQILCDPDVVLITETLHILSDMIRPVKRGPCLQTSTDIVLDTWTAANSIHISDDLKTASYSVLNQTLPKSSQRFLKHQVLSSRSFSAGQHFFDVDTRGSSSWRVGMCYPSMSRGGDQYLSGQNEKSWCLQRCNQDYNLVHNSNRYRTHLGRIITCHRFRVYLDYEAGQLSFYELCDPIRHLHTFTATFTEPLHAVLSVFEGSVTITN